MQASKPDLNETLKEGGGKTTASGHHRLRSVLVVSEVALALMLLVGAGLMMKSFWQILKTNPGFNGDNVLTMRMTLPRAKYKNEAQQRSFYEQLSRQVAALPGILARMQQCGEQLSSQVTLEVRQKTGEQINEI